jgi:hypothetical protein
MRFNYEQAEMGGVSVVSILETGGVFQGYSIEEVSAIAENLYPNYQSHNMSNVFSAIYFNFCVRRLLKGQAIPNTYTSKKLKYLNPNEFDDQD